MSECYTMVRGSAVRVTGLTPQGQIPLGPIEYGVSKSIARIETFEVTEGGGNELIRHEDTDEARLHIVSPTETIRFRTDINFTKCDPSVLSLITGVPVVQSPAGDVVGFDAKTRLPIKAFALEIWSRLADAPIRVSETVGFGLMPFGTGPFGLEEEVAIPRYCNGQEVVIPGIGFGTQPFDRAPFGRALVPSTSFIYKQKWGYTLFPFLKGGTVGGFKFSRDGLVSFNLRGAQTRKNPGWGVGPYDLDGPHKRLDQPVSRNTNWRNMVLTYGPPEPTTGTLVFDDIIYGGSGGTSTGDVIDGGSGGTSSPDIINGGRTS